MFELVDTQPDRDVQESEFRRLLGYPSHHLLEGRARELAEWARNWYARNGRPWIHAREHGPIDFTNERVNLNGASLVAPRLRAQWLEAEAHAAVVLAVSAGPECEAAARELWEAGKPDEYFFLEMYGSAVVEHLAASASGQVCGWADSNGLAVLPRYSPGYPGWDVAEQLKLWNLCGLSGKLEVLSSGMLRPKKSLLAVLALTHRRDKVRPLSHLVPCEECSLRPCQYRRVPYRHAPPLGEVGLSLRAGQSANGKARHLPADGSLNRQARYNFNSRVLARWSRERLRLETSDDGSLRARFLYEGTTCSNLGQPLCYYYHINLGPAEEGYRILELRCAPVPGDAGHAQQCEHLANVEGFPKTIAGEQPLLGEPLDRVLTWDRPYSPAGCYCDAASRAHKWGLVLEVIHYTLAQRENENAIAANATNRPALALTAITS